MFLGSHSWQYEKIGGVAKLRISGDELLAVEETTSGVLKQIFGFSSPLRPARSFGKLAG
jgi:hypothetical protein